MTKKIQESKLIYTKYKASGYRVDGISNREHKWIKTNNIDLKMEIYKTYCKRTRRKWDGDMQNITIACLDEKTGPRIIWWYRNPKNFPKNLPVLSLTPDESIIKVNKN